MDRVCRVCMSGAGTLRNIYNTLSESPSIEEMINACVEVKMKRDDQFPKKICQICIADLHAAYRFKKNYQVTMEQFGKLPPINISKESKPEEEEKDEEIPQKKDKINDAKSTPSKKHKLLKVSIKYSKDSKKRMKRLVFGKSGQKKAQNEKKSKGASPKNKGVKEKNSSSDSQRVQDCPYCHKHFDNIDELNTHIGEHTFQGDTKCPLCKKDFSYRCNLKTHLVNQVCVKRSEGYKCPNCSKIFTFNFNLRRHLTWKICKNISEKVKENVVDLT